MAPNVGRRIDRDSRLIVDVQCDCHVRFPHLARRDVRESQSGAGRVSNRQTIGRKAKREHTVGIANYVLLTILGYMGALIVQHGCTTPRSESSEGWPDSCGSGRTANRDNNRDMPGGSPWPGKNLVYAT